MGDRVARVPATRRRGWCALAPGTSVPSWCPDAPDLRRCPVGTRVPLPTSPAEAYIPGTPPRDRTGRYLGRRSRNWTRSSALEEVRGGGSRVRLTSRVTGLRPTGLVTVGAAALIEFIRVSVASRYRGAISLFRRDLSLGDHTGRGLETFSRERSLPAIIWVRAMRRSRPPRQARRRSRAWVRHSCGPLRQPRRRDRADHEHGCSLSGTVMATTVMATRGRRAALRRCGSSPSGRPARASAVGSRGGPGRPGRPAPR